MVLTIDLLDSRTHIRSGFCCGEESLDTYLCKQASQDLKKRVSTVFVLVDEPEMNVLGYYTLSSYTVNVAALEEKLAKRLPPYPALPATLLGRLAVDNNQKGRGFGELLLIDALKKSLDASQQVASLAVIVDALNEKAASFYKKYGFIAFNEEPMKLYLPMKSIEELLSSLSI
ncbi:MAG: GNAT family N-acetyltransferase [Microcoleus sp. PH2017_10_PVI_O_A]|uniref:GNAT family N-acetyltransferase n=1 Tax=unclassified Microcoleus TaxID=2642155 RepID=UPI001D8AB0B2|nr:MULTISPECIES: GNAT family N-acetyltransferase [unclassified Microcoleus]MCC3409193.1 GNAT family N-acetyltransferase [Microcoleus sp. PH2017_10_PVI_O_A]MCC3463430.1 GNAT family N-acetyltransferase [Microcoleus sp. PH2017_11_PCY_U_A]MCC3481797.1 GNAT family N-acetyltransferase [Microcoleus sp. PH2017_12_PCY_D_A]MCC3530816.1 GNAT family N-acetyltransferase [Microcoleus sp. PH2017_21_RUC_O_A]TAE76767.1 MAG: GNAT family N-acetyltransferase [Oscillatoriales cyanobacterium]